MDTTAAIESLCRYRDHRQELGHFLTAMLENNLANTLHSADPSSWANLKDIFTWVWEEMPANAWGSPEAVKAWLRPDFSSKPTVGDYALRITVTECPGCGNDLPADIKYLRAPEGWPLAGWDVLMELSISCSTCYKRWTLDKLGVPRPEVKYR